MQRERAYNVLSLPPLETPFFTNRQFFDRASAYNDLFAFCAPQVSGGYRHSSGLPFVKIEGKRRSKVYNLDTPVQKFAPLHQRWRRTQEHRH